MDAATLGGWTSRVCELSCGRTAVMLRRLEWRSRCLGGAGKGHARSVSSKAAAYAVGDNLGICGRDLSAAHHRRVACGIRSSGPPIPRSVDHGDSYRCVRGGGHCIGVLGVQRRASGLRRSPVAIDPAGFWCVLGVGIELWKHDVPVPRTLLMACAMFPIILLLSTPAAGVFILTRWLVRR